jgi:D-beta-D-heptose 7-phosphate kinase/D-beta-D-heptose 1-phosphate adenosyltransferase
MVKLASSLSRLGPAKILVMGDILLDTYTIGKARRISPEAPVAVVHVHRQDSLPGGAGNTALNLISLGAHVSLVGRIGQDDAGTLLKNLLSHEGISTDWLVIQNQYCTPIKNRIIAENQQIVRVDHEQVVSLNEDLEQYLINSLPELVGEAKVIALSDYGKGFLTPALLQAVMEYANKNGVIVITDPKGNDFSKYKGTTIIKPNQGEAYAAANLSPQASLDSVANKILQNTQAQLLMITRSEAGIALFESNGSRQDFPVDAKEVKDVTGAGDTVLAMLAHSLANNLSYREAAELCNVAAGIAIEHVGCARITLSDLAQRLLDKNINHKIFDQDHLFVLQEVLRSKPFSLLIIPDLAFFSEALFKAIKQLSDSQEVLLVYIADPNPSNVTLEMLASLKEVNFILIHSDNLKEAYHYLNPVETYLFDKQQLKTVSSLIELMDDLNAQFFAGANPVK